MDKETKKNKKSSMSNYKTKLNGIKQRILNYGWPVKSLFILFIIIGIYGGLHMSGEVIEKTGADHYAGLLGDFIKTPEGKIEMESGRTNVLLLGKGGAGHDAPDLTDTIIFTSVHHERDEITLVSLPRDIWIDEYKTKLNSIYYWGNRRDGTTGLEFAKEVVSTKVGQPIHYAVVVDFTAFKDVIDIIDGIEVKVEQEFIDKRYPIPGKEDDLCEGDPNFECRYETIEFKKGVQHMDGDRALKFVRSRNAEGDQGTDLARAARQQKVIEAVKQKVISSEVLLSRDKVNELISTGQEHIETDLDMSAAAILARRGLDAKGQFSSYVLPEEMLEFPEDREEYDNLYVYTPVDKDWTEIRDWISDLLDQTSN